MGDINKALDDFVALKTESSSSYHEFKSQSDKKKQKPPKLIDLQIDWLQQLNKDVPGRMGLSPLEHKWLVRMLTKNMRIGVVRLFVCCCTTI